MTSRMFVACVAIPYLDIYNKHAGILNWLLGNLIDLETTKPLQLFLVSGALSVLTGHASW